MHVLGPGEFIFQIPQGYEQALEAPTAQGASVVARYSDGWRKFTVDPQGRATLVGVMSLEEARKWAGPRRAHLITQ